MNTPNIRKILKDYLSGRAGAKAGRAVDEWYQSFDNKEVIKNDNALTGREIWDRIERNLSQDGTEAEGPGLALTDTERPIQLTAEADLQETARRGTLRRLMRPMRVAAAVILLAGAAGTFIYVRQRNADCCTEPGYTTIKTGTGERRSMTMADGSKLTLDAATTLRIQEDFSHHRHIELVDGQAFFDVAPDKEHPFTVKIGTITTTVLGTSFGVSAYEGLPSVRIGVVSGKVSVGENGEPSNPESQAHQGKINPGSHGDEILEASQELVFDKTANSYHRVPLDEALTAWQEGRFVMNDLSFDEMATVCLKQYGVQLQAGDDAVRHTRYTTELDNKMTPQQVLEVLAAIHYSKIRHEGSKTIFSSKTSNNN